MIQYPNDSRRKAEVLFPPNTLKAKAGSGGLDASVIEKAQKIIDESGIDFIPTGQRYMASLQEGMKTVKAKRGVVDDESLIATMLYPSMQLKANGGMFGYPLITSVAARLIRFLEQIREPDDDALEIVTGFCNTINAIMLMGERDRKVASRGDDLYVALDEACQRYFEKHGY